MFDEGPRATGFAPRTSSLMSSSLYSDNGLAAKTTCSLSTPARTAVRMALTCRASASTPMPARWAASTSASNTGSFQNPPIWI